MHVESKVKRKKKKCLSIHLPVAQGIFLFFQSLPPITTIAHTTLSTAAGCGGCRRCSTTTTSSAALIRTKRCQANGARNPQCGTSTAFYPSPTIFLSFSFFHAVFLWWMRLAACAFTRLPSWFPFLDLVGCASPWSLTSWRRRARNSRGRSGGGGGGMGWTLRHRSRPGTLARRRLGGEKKRRRKRRRRRP